MDRQKISILYFIQLPPPMHGVSAINSIVFNSKIINEGFEKSLLEIKFSDALRELRKISLRKLTGMFKLNRMLRDALRDNPDYVYFSLMPVGIGFWRDLVFVRTLKRSSARIIYHLHNRGIRQRSGCFLNRMAYRYAFSDSVIIHLSDRLLESEIYSLKLRNSTALAIPNGIPEPAVQRPSEPGKPSETGGRVNVLFFSNLFPAKGMFEAVKIMKEVKDAGKEVHLFIAGEFMRSKYQRKLMKLIGGMGLRDMISVMGPKFGIEKAGLFKNSHVFLFPSYFSQECMPLVLLEAMAYGLPVISSNIGAIPEIMENGKEGYLVEPEDTEGFVTAVLDLSQNVRERETMGKAAREKFLSHFTAQSFETRLRNTLEKETGVTG